MFNLPKIDKSKDLRGVEHIYFHEDYSVKDLNENKVGRKGLSLFRLQEIDVPVPPFFVISPLMYREHLYSAFDERIIQMIKENKLPKPEDLSRMVDTEKLLKSNIEILKRSYSRLSGFADSWVSVRSSVVYPENLAVSFSGIFPTELNVRGIDELEEAVKLIYSSVFTNEVIEYLNRSNVNVGDLQIAVVVQRMIQSEVSGIVMTKDPVTGDLEKLSIECVYGLGDVIANGEITPDRYVLNKRNLTFQEKHISPQDWMRVRKISNKKSKKHFDATEKVQISSSWSHHQKLEDRFVEEVAKIALIIEDKNDFPQVVEWVWESGNVWVLQTKPLIDPEVSKVDNLSANIINNSANQMVDIAVGIAEASEIESKAVDSAIKQIKKENPNITESELAEKIPEISESLINKDLATYFGFNKMSHKKEELLEKENSQNESRVINNTMKEFNDNLGNEMIDENDYSPFLISSGSSISSGIFTGKALVVNKLEKNIIKKVNKSRVVVVKKYRIDLQPLLLNAGAVIVEEMGVSSDLSIVMRERGIPVISGIEDATMLFIEDQLIKVDATLGGVYSLIKKNTTKETSSIPIDESRENIEIYTSKEKIDVPEEIASVVEQEKPKLSESVYTATKVYINMINLTDRAKQEAIKTIPFSDGVCAYDLDETVLDEKIHPMFFVAEREYKEFSNGIARKIDQIADVAKGNEVIVSLGNAYREKFVNLEKGNEFEDPRIKDNVRGGLRYASNIDLFRKLVMIVKKTRNVYRDRNVSLAIHSPVNSAIMGELKKEVLLSGLRRSSTFNIYAIIESSAEVLMLNDILETDIDGCILNLDKVREDIYGESNILNGLNSNNSQAMLKIIEQVAKTVVTARKKAILISDNEEEVRYAISKGYIGISTSYSKLEPMRKVIKDQEMAIVLGNK